MTIDRDITSDGEGVADRLLPPEGHRSSEFGWLDTLNRTAARYPADACLHHLVGERAADAPDHVAVLHEYGSLSYGELLPLAHGLAWQLREAGVGPEARVALCARRGPGLAIGMLGILEAGGAFVPLDPDYPLQRLQTMLRDAGVQAVVAEREVSPIVALNDLPVLYVDDAEAWTRPTAPDTNVVCDNLAYVIYTSGSTGAPKGIALRHGGVVNNLVDLISRYEISARDRVMALSSPSFDMCVFEVLGTLIAGGSIVTPEAAGAKDPSHWAHLIRQHRVTVWNSAPALLEMLVTYVAERPELHPTSLRLALLGGDWVPVTLPDRLRSLAPAVRVVVLGGATEVSIHSTVYEVDTVEAGSPSIPYGQPMANQRVYVLDECERLLPRGEAGELHIGGIGLARGYVNRPGMTAERFVPDPFSGAPGARMYRTGDRARFLTDGNLQLLGRIDLQTKVRGNRVDLGEIETVLQQHPAVEGAAVVARSDRDSGDQIIACVVPAYERAGLDVRGETERRHIQQWEAVYENTYRDSVADATRNFSGWVTSYDGVAFTDAALTETLEATIERIRSLGPRRVLEIGCGTGLVLFRIAPEVSRYDASDVSEAAVVGLRREIARRPGLAHVTVSQYAADELEDVKPATYDLVILNSVTQHFPDAAYLARVLDRATRVLEPGGAIFVGDVRALPLMELFHTSIAVHQAEDSQTAGEILEPAGRRARFEKELFVDPRFFEVLAGHHENSRSVALLKRGSLTNEITKYHYDVLIRIGDSTRESGRVDTVSWSRENLTPEALGERLAAQGERPLRVVDIPNGRLEADIESSRLLHSSGGEEVWGRLRQSFTGPGIMSDPVDPEMLCRLAGQRGVEAVALWPLSGDPRCFDLVCQSRHFGNPGLETIDTIGAALTHEPAEPLTNRPSRNTLGSSLTPVLKAHVGATLPEFMVPAAIQYVEALPLSPNGKLDRRALSRLFEPEDHGAGGREASFTETPMHRVMADLWADVLGGKVSPDDNFFAIGGHSLTATQVISRVNELFGLCLPLRSLFEMPSVVGLCSCVENAWRDAGLDPADLQRTCLEVENLSEQAARSLLLEENIGPGD